MKKLIKLTAMALCTLTLCLTSCSKDDNNENIGGKEKELTKEQFLEARTKVLNSIPGSYKGLISADAKNQGLSGNIKWNINEDGIVVCKKFPYEALAFGISTEDNSSEATQLRAALIEVPLANLQFRLIGNPDSKDPADLYATPTGAVSFNNKQFNSSYTMNNSEMQMQFTIYKLVKIDKAHATAIIQEDFDTPVSFYLTGYKK